MNVINRTFAFLRSPRSETELAKNCFSSVNVSTDTSPADKTVFLSASFDLESTLECESPINKDGGFSVVELLITLVVIGVTFGAFVTSFTSIQNIYKKAIDINYANAAAFAKLQQYENLNYNSLPNTAPQGTLQQVEDFSASLPTTLQKPRTGIVYINTVSSTLKQVVVDVRFGSGPSERQVQYADFIQKYGVGR
jgi:Tfp pilus assembly protein PilE